MFRASPDVDKMGAAGAFSLIPLSISRCEDVMNDFSKSDISKIVETAEDLNEPVRVPVEAYISEDYVRAERDKLWRKVWQQVGRLEEIPEVGNFLTYDILDDSLLI